MTLGIMFSHTMQNRGVLVSGCSHASLEQILEGEPCNFAFSHLGPEVGSSVCAGGEGEHSLIQTHWASVL